MKAKIVIAGGGVVGLSVALHCAKKSNTRTEPVVLVDRGSLGAGSSIRSGAVLRQHDSDRNCAGMARDSLRYYQSLARNTGRSVGYKPTGVLTIVGPKQTEEAAALDQAIEMQQALGIIVQRVGAEEIRALLPGAQVDDGVVGAFEPDGGIVDPMLTLECFASLARSSGATVRMGSEVTELLIDGGRVRGVKTARGDIEAETVVLSAGPWTQGLLARYDVQLPVRTIRPNYLFISMPGAHEGDQAEGEDLFSTTYRRRHELGLAPRASTGQEAEEELELRFGMTEGDDAPEFHPVLHDLEHDFYAKCEPANGRTRISRLDPSNHALVDNPDDYDSEVESDFEPWARGVIGKRIPAYVDEESIGSDSNLVCQTTDGRGIIGPVEQLPGLFVISGFMGQDFNLAPSIGEGVAQMLWNEPVSAFDPEYFSPGRFA